MIDSNASTTPSDGQCDHRDMAGDSLIETRGHKHWCTACGTWWHDADVVVVGDEILPREVA